jgi:hypothetical protein
MKMFLLWLVHQQIKHYVIQDAHSFSMITLIFNGIVPEENFLILSDFLEWERGM